MSEAMVECPFCAEKIRETATKCRYCGSDLDEDDTVRPRGDSGMVERMLIPVGRPVTSIAAGYLALFGIIPMCGLPFSAGAVVCGVLALKAIRRDPTLSGSGRAWFGIIVGGLMTLISLLGCIVLVIGMLTGRR